MASRIRRRFSLIALLFVCALSFVPAFLFAAEKEARVTVLVHDVKLMPEDEQARPATLNETIQENTAVRTGTNSRSELTFVDLTITRLGSNTIFSFNKAGRSVQLNGGAILLRVPKDSGGATMKTAACSVAIAGTTVVLEATRSGRNRLHVLEGVARMALTKAPNEWARVGPGQMLDVPPGATSLPAVQNFDVDRFMKTNPLITDFPTLPSRDLIYASAANGSERVYSSQPVSGGTPPPGPPFGRPPHHGRAPVTNTPTGNNPTNPNGTKETGRTRVPRKPSTPIAKTKPTPSPTPRKRNVPPNQP